MIVLKSEAEIEKIRRASRIVAEVLERMKEEVVAGATTLDLDRVAEEMIRKQKAKPAFKGYRGYQATLCTSVNEEVVHGIPSGKRICRREILWVLIVGRLWRVFTGMLPEPFVLGR